MIDVEMENGGGWRAERVSLTFVVQDGQCKLLTKIIVSLDCGGDDMLVNRKRRNETHYLEHPIQWGVASLCIFQEALSTYTGRIWIDRFERFSNQFAT